MSVSKIVAISGLAFVSHSSLWSALDPRQFFDWLVSKKTPFDTISSCQRPLRLNFFGDVYLSRDRMGKMEDVFQHMKPTFLWADENIVNFESVVTDSKVRAFPDGDFALKMDPDGPKVMARAGIRYVTRANNHSMDFGWEGAEDTNKALTAQKISWAGVGPTIFEALKPMIIEKRGLKVAVLSLNMTFPRGAWATETTAGVAYPFLDKIYLALEQAKKGVDFLVVVTHWGEELSLDLRPYQPDMAALYIKNGADVVLGHHTHIAQHTTEIQNKPVGYGLGNFVFASLSDQADMGLGAHVEFCNDGGERSTKVFYTPLDTYNRRTNYQTRPLPSTEFSKTAKKHLEQNVFSPDTLIYFQDKNAIKPLKEWLDLLKKTETN